MLESIFLLVSLRRREAELFQTEALVTAILGAAAENFEPVKESLQAYKNTMFPFLEGEKVKREDMAREALKQWTSHKALKVQPLWTASDGQTRKIQSKLRKDAERTQQAEELRRKKRHTRI